MNIADFANALETETPAIDTAELDNYLQARFNCLARIVDQNAKLMHIEQRSLHETRLRVFADARRLLEKQPPQYLRAKEVVLWLESENGKLIEYQRKAIGSELLTQIISIIHNQKRA